MSAGKMRHILEIQKPSTLRDGFGRPKSTWTTVARGVPASITTLQGREADNAKQLVATATHTITMRYLHNLDVLAKHRIVFCGRYFNIGWVDDIDEVKRELKCLVSEVIA